MLQHSSAQRVGGEGHEHRRQVSDRLVQRERLRCDSVIQVGRDAVESGVAGFMDDDVASDVQPGQLGAASALEAVDSFF
jgi:hypothetical protein